MTVTDARTFGERTVEERLAALEAAVPRTIELSVPAEWTEAEKSELVRRMGEVAERHEIKWMPPGPALTLAPEMVSQLLRECITVVKPGEVLVLRCPEEWTAHQAQQMQDYANLWLEGNAPGVKVLTVPHVEMAVIESPERKEGATGAAPSPALPD